ncbi:WbqC family protein [Hugenholtzia roseola]|uniref:WbqC family protein n=1 Tax=Hugenholtzia roseola TaxID=1002 RepID=UPI00047E1E22|nr:WbqC family protein [Hugenholtzia roseola]
MPSLPTEIALVELHYLPCYDYGCLFERHDEVWIDIHEHFVKQTYRNRAQIQGANGVLSLIVPVQKGSQRKPITEVEIAYQQQWQKLHWRSLQSAYGKTPYFLYLRDHFEPFYQSQHYKTLFEWNEALLKTLQKLFKWKAKIRLTDQYYSPQAALQLSTPTQKVSDWRNKIVPNQPPIFLQEPYFQAFSAEFVPNLSLIDTVFNRFS